MRYRAARPVLRKSDDTHIQRATTLHSRPLAALAGSHQRALLPPRHPARPVLARLRLPVGVPPSVALVAAAGLAVARRHRLGAAIAPSRVSSLSRSAAVSAPDRATTMMAFVSELRQRVKIPSHRAKLTGH